MFLFIYSSSKSTLCVFKVSHVSPCCCSVVGLDIQDEMGRHEVGHIDNSMKIPLNQGDGCRFEGEFTINKVRPHHTAGWRRTTCVHCVNHLFWVADHLWGNPRVCFLCPLIMMDGLRALILCGAIRCLFVFDPEGEALPETSSFSLNWVMLNGGAPGSASVTSDSIVWARWSPVCPSIVLCVSLSRTFQMINPAVVHLTLLHVEYLEIYKTC